MKLKFIVPLVLFGALVAFFAIGLTRDPREVPSPLIDKPAPPFTLTQLHDEKSSFSTEGMKGKVWLLNVWASWCVACRQEHPLLVELSKRKSVPIVGLNYKDKPDAAAGHHHAAIAPWKGEQWHQILRKRAADERGFEAEQIRGSRPTAQVLRRHRARLPGTMRGDDDPRPQGGAPDGPGSLARRRVAAAASSVSGG